MNNTWTNNIWEKEVAMNKTELEIKIKEIEHEEATNEAALSHYKGRVAALQRRRCVLSDDHLKLLCRLATIAMLRETPDEREGRIREAKTRALVAETI